MRKHVLLALPALVAALPTLAAEPGLPETEAVRAALDAHPSVQAADARVDAARAEAGALRRGTQEFNLYTSYMSRTVDREGRYNEFDAQLTRPVRLPGKGRLDRQIGDLGIEAAQNMAEDARHQAALVLAQEWWDWLGAAEEAKVDRQAVSNLEATLKAVQRRVALRDAAQLEADQAAAALGTAKVAAAQSAGRAQLARVRLATHFASLPLPVEAPEVPRPVMPGESLESYGVRMFVRSHEIAAAEAELHKREAMAERVRQDRLADPSVGVRLFSERGGMEKGAGVIFSMPIGGGHRTALADQADAQANAARADALAARMAVQETASGDIAEVRFRYESWQRAREALDAQVAALVKLRRGQAAGEIDLSDVLFGERQVQDAFRAEAAARTEAMRMLTRIRIDSHELWIGDAEDAAKQ